MILQVEDLSLSFGGILALNHISFSIDSKNIVAIIGPNGAGKTTLFNCLTGFYRADSGIINFYPSKQAQYAIPKLLGQVSWKTPLSALYYRALGGTYLVARAGIARTFQNIRLFQEMTVIENLLVAQHAQAERNLVIGLLNLPRYQRWERAAIEKAYHWLDVFDLCAFANRLAGTLSYGQQRHLEIARAMCTEPKLLCLDEPAAGLNPKETDMLSARIQSLRSQFKTTILLIEHDMSMVMGISDRIIVLDQGSIIANDLPSAIRHNPAVKEAYLG